jgi:hypothetical protein
MPFPSCEIAASTELGVLVNMAPYVSRFLARLFQIGPETAAVRRATSAQDDLFRFRIEFVKRRVWPLARASAPVVCTPDDDEVVEPMISGGPAHDRELAIARAGCALLDREKGLGIAAGARGAEGTRVTHEIEALKRWCIRIGAPFRRNAGSAGIPSAAWRFRRP